MRVYVAITDFDWFGYLEKLRPDEVNFWQPSASASSHALTPGEPLLFKLHSPRNFIVGGGFFSHYSVVPASFAWSAFGEKNGAATEQEMRRRIERYRKVESNDADDYAVGCILLQAPFFFPTDEWLPIPEWHREIVRGKGYSTDDAIGQRLWNEVEARLQAHHITPELIAPAPAAERRYGEAQITLPRLGQGGVSRHHHRRVPAPVRTHEFPRSAHVLEAAHIRPYSHGGNHTPANGILLRQDVHTLFDRGYLTVTPDYRVEVSRRIREEFHNGKEYYALHGKEVSLPNVAAMKPSTEQLQWHNEHIYRE